MATAITAAAAMRVLRAAAGRLRVGSRLVGHRRRRSGVLRYVDDVMTATTSADLRHEELRRPRIRPRCGRHVGLSPGERLTSVTVCRLKIRTSRPPPRADGYVVVLAQRVRTEFQCSEPGAEHHSLPNVCRELWWLRRRLRWLRMRLTADARSDCDSYGCRAECCRRRSRCTARAACATSAPTTTSCMPTSSASGPAGTIDQPVYDGFTYDNSNELFYDDRQSRTTWSVRRLAGR